MQNMIFLYSKDAMSMENFSRYGNRYWKTPNFDEMAQKGTEFLRHYTAATSTSMAFSAMLTGKNPYEFTDRKFYTHVQPTQFETIFSRLQAEGYDCHILWSPDYMIGAWPYVRCFGNESKTHIHVLEIQQTCGIQRPHDFTLERNDTLLEKTKRLIYDELNSIPPAPKQFIWMHLPHVLRGRCSYGDDIDIFDEILGFVRKKYGDESIYITADHGHMNLHKNIAGYGFHVYELTCHVPLITPCINGLKKVERITSHTDLMNIILEGRIPKHDYVLTDTLYYCQPNRKLAVIGQRYKYIYNKRSRTEELYDLEWDPQERYNLLERDRYDNDRSELKRITELYFYPYHFEAIEALKGLRAKKAEIWRNGTWSEEADASARNMMRHVKARIWMKLNKCWKLRKL